MATTTRQVWSTTHGVELHEPTPSKPYYRLSYRDRHGKRFQPSAGRNFDAAWARANELDAELSRTVTTLSAQPVGHLVDAFLEAKAPLWSPRHASETRKYLTAALVGVWTLRCDELTRRDVSAAIGRAKAPSMTRHYAAAVSALITWGHHEEYLPNTPARYKPSETKTGRSAAGRAHGESSLFIDEELIPSAEDIQLVADAMHQVGENKKPKQGERLWLMTALAASTGLRQGELFDLRPDRITFETGKMRVTSQVVHMTGEEPQVTPPKWGRPRVASLPERTLWGAPLRDRLREYVDDMDPDQLIFAAPKSGRWQHPSNFSRDYWKPARALVPSWSSRWTWHSLRHSYCSHLLAQGADVADIAKAAGHEDAGVTMKMYVGATRGVTDRLNALL